MYLARIIWTHNELKRQGIDPRYLACSNGVHEKLIAEILEAETQLALMESFRLPVEGPVNYLPEEGPVKNNPIRAVTIDHYTFTDGLLLGKEVVRQDGPLWIWHPNKWGFFCKVPDSIAYEFAGQLGKDIIEPWVRWDI